MILMTTLLLLAAAAPDIQPATGEAELRSYVIEALENHPALQQRHEEWQAALERIPQVTALDDPMFTYGQFILSESQRAKMAFAQKFPWFGTLRARGDKAAAEAEAVYSRLIAERDAIVYRVKKSYYEYALLAERLRIVEAQADLLEYVEDIVRVKLALALATDDELLRVSIARTELDDRQTGLEQLRPALSRQLGTAVGREHDELLPWPAETILPPPAPDAESISDQIRATNPSLDVFEHRIAALDVQEELARKAGLPNITLGLDWTAISNPTTVRPDRPYPATLNAASRTLSTLSGNTPFVPRNSAIDAYALRYSNEPIVYPDRAEDNLMISLSLSVPLWRKKVRGGVNEARHRRVAAEREQHALFLELDRSAAMVRFEIEDAARRYQLFGDSLIPQAEMTYESLQEKYAADTAGKEFIDILDAVQQLLDFQLEQARALTRWQQAWAELEMITGKYSLSESTEQHQIEGSQE